MNLFFVDPKTVVVPKISLKSTSKYKNTIDTITILTKMFHQTAQLLLYVNLTLIYVTIAAETSRF